MIKNKSRLFVTMNLCAGLVDAVERFRLGGCCGMVSFSCAVGLLVVHGAVDRGVLPPPRELKLGDVPVPVSDPVSSSSSSRVVNVPFDSDVLISLNVYVAVNLSGRASRAAFFRSLLASGLKRHGLVCGT